MRAGQEKSPAHERIAKVIARAGLCSRREAETWITAGRVAVNGKVVASPARNVTTADRIAVDGREIPQRETTPFYPRSPYGAAKLYAHWICVNYREAYGLYACNGILFNHESPLRGETFVSRKITRGLTRIRAGLQDVLHLGNLDARRDWGHARDYVRAQWLMLQQPEPEDYVVATGEQHSVRDFVMLAGRLLGMNIEWRGSGIEEAGMDGNSGRVVVRVDPRYFRPTEVDSLVGDASRIRARLGWKPEITFESLVREMIESDAALAERDALVMREGYKVYRHHE